MIGMTIALCALFFFVVALTFRAWLHPESASMTMTILGVVFFISCFVLGVYFSVQRMKGDVWLI